MNPALLSTLSTFVDVLYERATCHPNQIGYRFLNESGNEHATLTYLELHQQAQTIAAWLQSRGGHQERVILLYPPGLDFIAAFFGCLYAGAIAVPAYPPRQNQSLERLQTIVADAQPKFALTNQQVLAIVDPQLHQLPNLQALQWVATDQLDKMTRSNWQRPSIKKETLAFLQYTSGSTAAPKGVMITQGNLLHNSYLIHQAFGHSSRSCGVIWLPPYHDMGLVGGILQPLYSGMPVVLMAPTTFLYKPFYWLRAISHYKATTSGGPSFAYDLCIQRVTEAQRASLDLSSWKVAFNGAEPVRAETIEKFTALFASCGFRSEAFYPCYGMAETTLIVSGGDKTKAPTLQAVQENALRQNQIIPAEIGENGSQILVSCGQPLTDQQVIVVDPDKLIPCLPNEVGEIWVSSPSVAQGYWNNFGATIASFHAYVADSGEGPFLRTGDLGFLQNGEVYVTGRLKDLIIIRGRNYYPQDIELTVRQNHPACYGGNGAVFTVDRQGELRLIVVQEVNRRYLRQLNYNEVVGQIRQTVVRKHELQVHTVMLVKPGSIPKTSSGKIRRFACREQFLAQNLEIVPAQNCSYRLEPLGAGKGV
ncbi:fatty acyl-AMP ligase [Trichocoleus sp. FACHB-591]|uniref:fatty acyl-AMP ligase n=1 Tax=Trichocoleus sp. FACHB-591 TaxID=2692872 RepID=UPI0016865399|nr:fatty acyl-AMP ligase [Trichocoleus sp. FACHB-591]MBD2097356.1 fatty acyl-AMP ligase [Trichocoleus sp. FACHB-591]